MIMYRYRSLLRSKGPWVPNYHARPRRNNWKSRSITNFRIIYMTSFPSVTFMYSTESKILWYNLHTLWEHTEPSLADAEDSDWLQNNRSEWASERARNVMYLIRCPTHISICTPVYRRKIRNKHLWSQVSIEINKVGFFQNSADVSIM